MATSRDQRGASDTAETEILVARRAIDSTVESTRVEETRAGSPAAAERARRARESADMITALMPGAGSGAAGTSGSTGAALEARLGSAVHALHQDEIRRSRLLGQFGIVLALAVVGALFVMPPGDPVMTNIAIAAILIAGGGCGYLYYITSRPELFTPGRIAIIWVSGSVGVSAGVAYFGIFSAGAMVVTLGVYFLALGRSLFLSFLVYFVCATVQVAVAVLVIAGVIEDPGIIHARYLAPEVLVVLEILIQFVIAASFVMARASRRTTLSVVSEHERVVRALGQRDALLHEARQDLERALQVGGAGRFSGQTLGSFQLGGILGRGSMGEVYEALHIPTGEPAAVKMLSATSMGNRSYVMRFLREVKLAATIDVQHVVRVLEVSDATSPVPYLAMERLRGRDLAQVLREQRRLSGEQVIDLVDQVGKGITAAARAGIVHRDLKPQNLFLADQPGGPAIWKILDFGVGKLVGDGGTLTEGQVVGTPIYMAPEQAQGKEVDQRADLYALAAIAYRCLTGHLPYRAKDVPSILYNVVYDMPVRPTALADMPLDIDDFLLVAMAKDPA
ncbi:MAG TPA: serine/threonine-protein kinase, partial [Kofleriaceae bacterium]|nr:serine/threonine-protein kinase [Kofleriaceae bacterium]